MPVANQTMQKQAAVAERRSFGAVVRFILVVLVWQAIAIGFTECVLFIGGLGEEEIFKFDPQIGFEHFPDKRVTWRSEGFARSYFNSDGMREPNLTVEKPADVYRIALLGDSMVESLQVPIEETFGQILQRQLTQELSHPVQVLNFGNSGYSTAQEYLLLDKKVFRYKPDLVVAGYSSRDMFENWSPPDQTITNVRPCALCLPGSHLVVDSSPVEKWLKSPRARFLSRIEWLRHHSRIWGLISAAETQLSFRDSFYKSMIDLLTHPGKTIKAWVSSIPSPHELLKHAAPSFDIRFFDHSARDLELSQSSIRQAPAQIPPTANRLVTMPLEARKPDISCKATAKAGMAASLSPIAVAPSKEKADSKSTKAASTQKSEAAVAAAPASGNSTYLKLMQNTMRSLLRAMNEKCKQRGARFVLLVMPCRAGLVPSPGAEKAFFNITFADEIRMIQEICQQEQIPFLDSEALAENLPLHQRVELFYAMHLRAQGQQKVAEAVKPFLTREIPEQVRQVVETPDSRN